ncbi:MAG: carboxymuconolactone decarboxylase family protein [Hyphomicrobium sp.]|nr:carboxymuconolactone decarboxylase family protein [Hyphomicrobium sp.]
MTSPRITYDAFAKAVPAAQAALIAMGKTADESGVDKEIIELVKLRVSQINNCAFCLQIHLNVSRKLGLAQEKLDLVATWEEAGIFSEKECAALAWAEALTRLDGRSVSDAVYAQARKHFSESEILFLSTSIATINAWNRLGAAFRFAPPIPRKVAAAASYTKRRNS